MNSFLEIKRIKKDSIVPNDNVTFDVASPFSEGITYDNMTGEIILPETGLYNVRWWIATQTSLSGCMQFALQSTQGDLVLGCSPTKQGQVVGFADIYAKTDNVKLSLVNTGKTQAFLSKIVPETAALFVTRVPEPASLKAFGQVNSNTATVAIAADIPAIVPLPEIGDFDNIVMEPENSMTIKETGYYHLIYSFYPQFTASTPVTLTFAVRSNEVNIEQTVSTASVPAVIFDASYFGSTIVSLFADDVVDVTVASTSNISMSFDTRTVSSLILHKID